MSTYYVCLLAMQVTGWLFAMFMAFVGLFHGRGAIPGFIIALFMAPWIGYSVTQVAQ